MKERGNRVRSLRKRSVVPSAEVTHVLGRELLGVCMAALASYGISRRRIIEIARESLRTAGDISTANEMFRDVDLLGDLANEWAEHPSYVDQTGRPRILPIEGRGTTFAALVKKHFGDRSTKEIVEFGCRTKILERVGENKVAQLGGCVIFAGHPTLMLAHAIHSMRWFLGTTLANANPQTLGGRTVPDRRACLAIPEKAFPEFVEAMRLPMIGLIEMGNRWLSARAHRRGKTVTMGVHAYLFRDSVLQNERPRRRK